MLLAGFLAVLPQAQPPPEPTRLVVMVVVDQMIPEQLQRLAPVLEGGFARFLREGAVFWSATVDYANTETGPGHATLATGCYPAKHGIVANQFFDRERGSVVYCVGDREARRVTSAGIEAGAGSVSPVHLRREGLGDLLQAARSESKTVAIAGKDRAAVLLGGRQPDAALWWDRERGGFASSTHYGEELPEFAGAWNAAWTEDARGWEWTCELQGDLAALGTAPDDREGESGRPGRTLPRRLPEQDSALASAVFATPLIDRYVLEVAALAVDALELGRDDAVDFLGLGLSGCDVVGHDHGPDSVEVTDLLVRADRELGRLFERLDETVGAGRWLACLSSDHGVLDLPESLNARHLSARRVPDGEVQAMLRAVQQAFDSQVPEGARLELEFVEQGFVFDETAARAAGLDPAALRLLIAGAAAEAPWIAAAYTAEELCAPAPLDPWLPLYSRCTALGRAADVVLRPDPWLLIGMRAGTSHGSPYPYDRRVPLVFVGPGVKPQQRFDAASPTDAVPTLLALLGIPAPSGLDGRVLDLDP